MTLERFMMDQDSSEIEELETQREKNIRKLRERAKEADFGGEISL